MTQIKYSELAANLMPFILANISGQSADAPTSSATTVHDFLGPYHTLPTLSSGYVLASPASTAGAPSFRVLALSDFQTPADTRYALSGRLINAGGGLTGGGALTADVTLNVGAGTGITVGADAVNVNEGHAFSWSASHTFGAGLAVSGANTLTFGGDVTLSRSAADVLALGANDSVGTSTFTSGFTGTGWRVNYSASTGYSAEFDNLVVRQQMRIYELLIHKIRSGNGSYLFSPGGKVSAVSGGPTYTLTFDTDHGLASNGTTQKDLVRAQKFDLGLGGVYISVLQIESIISTTQLTATVVSGAVPAMGYEYTRFGNTGDTNRQGGVYITADDTNAPYINIYDGVTSFADWQSASKTRTQIGKMNSTYGAGASNWGFGVGDYSSNNYLRYADDSTGFVFRAGDGSLFIDSDGARMSLPTGASLSYVPNSSIAWSTTPETAGTEVISIRAARSTGGVFPANSLNIRSQDTGAARQATLNLEVSNTTTGSTASIDLYSQGDGVDYIVAAADTITLTGSTIADRINVGTATGAPVGYVFQKNDASGGGPQTAYQTSGTGAPDWRVGIPASVNANDFFIFDNSSGGFGQVMRFTRATGAALISGTTTFSLGVNIGSATGAATGNARASIGYSAGDAGTPPKGGFFGKVGAGDGGPQFAMQAATTNAADWRIGIPGSAGSENFFIFDNSTSGAGTVMTVERGTGRVGVGTASPQARLHTYDTDGGTLHNWRTTGIAGTRVTIIPNGTGDCTQSCTVMGTAYDSSGNAWELRGSLESGVSAGSEQTVQVAGDATDNLHVKVKTDGQIEIVRNAGARTWSVCLSAWWR